MFVSGNFSNSSDFESRNSDVDYRRKKKCSGLVHWDDPEGWDGVGRGESGWGTHVNPWLIHVNVWQKPLQYCKVISLQLIKINGKKNYEICKKC